MSVYTVFLQHISGGTTYVEAFDASDEDEAAETGRLSCATAWDCPTDRIHVLGVAEGAVKILFWEDLGD